MTRTILITGAARGVGRASAEAFARDGWRVVAGVRDVEAAAEVFDGVPQVAVVRLDVADAASVAEGVARAQELAGGALTCVVPNAGYAQMGAAEDVDLDEARRMFDTNLFGAVAVVQAALPAMREARTGSIVAVTSIGAHLGHPLLSMYHASKYAMNAWAEVMRLELRPFGVRVHVVEPGMVNTDFSKATRVTGGIARGEGPYAPLFEQLKSGFRAWREELGTGPEVVADAVLGAATDPTTPFRIPTGPDGEILARARRDLGDDEFQEWLLGFLRVSWGQTPA